MATGGEAGQSIGPIGAVIGRNAEVQALTPKNESLGVSNQRNHPGPKRLGIARETEGTRFRFPYKMALFGTLKCSPSL